MHSMTQEQPLVIGGVDAHADTHHLAALDQRGALLATESFSTTTSGYAQALDWLSGFGMIHAVAIESTGCMPQGWCAIYASTGSESSRSTSRMPTHAGASARAMPSMPRWLRGCCWPARQP